MQRAPYKISVGGVERQLLFTDSRLRTGICASGSLNISAPSLRESARCAGQARGGRVDRCGGSPSAATNQGDGRRNPRGFPLRRNAPVRGGAVASARFHRSPPDPWDRSRAAIAMTGSDRSVDQPRPKIAVAWFDMMPPTPCTTAIRAPST